MRIGWESKLGCKCRMIPDVSLLWGLPKPWEQLWVNICFFSFLWREPGNPINLHYDAAARYIQKSKKVWVLWRKLFLPVGDILLKSILWNNPMLLFSSLNVFLHFEWKSQNMARGLLAGHSWSFARPFQPGHKNYLWTLDPQKPMENYKV